MAITMTKEPSGIYPAYNDSFIEFSSDLADNNKAEITAYPVDVFTRVFVIYPDANGKYLFNLKQIVKVIFNEEGFEDENFFTDSYYKNIDGLYLLQQIQIKVLSDSSSETTSKNYGFFKAVKQISEPIYSNNLQLLSFTNDGINHSMTYFEGFPFHFDLQLATIDEAIIVKSLNTGNESEEMIPTETGAFRINVDRGAGKNWTSDNFLPLTEGLNRLEIYENGDFKTNVLLTKKKISCGVYLKWFNRSGGFSHYLFNEFYVSQTKGKDSGKVFNDEFKNISEATGNFKSTGKEAQETLNIKARYEIQDYENIKDIFKSPLVQMYTSRNAYKEGSFIDVFVDGTISFSNKRGKNEISLIVDLPEVITAKL